jgi:hypothetical protein
MTLESSNPTSAGPSRRAKIVPWLGPVFLIALVAIFLLLPFPLMDKLHGVCFGI